MGITGLLPFLAEVQAILPASLDDLHTIIPTQPPVKKIPLKLESKSFRSPRQQQQGRLRQSIERTKLKHKGSFAFHTKSPSTIWPDDDIKNGSKQGGSLIAAVDAYSWLHKGAFACSEALYYGDREAAKAVYVKYCLKYAYLLQDHGIKPVLVFDGTSLPAKHLHTDSGRSERKREARIKADALVARGLAKQAREYFPRCLEVTFEMAHDVIEACRENDIDYIVAPYEADAQMAYLQMSGLVDFVITEDSDLVVFGCERIFFKLDMNGNGMFYEKSRLLRTFVTSSATNDNIEPCSQPIVPCATTPTTTPTRFLRSSQSLPNLSPLPCINDRTTPSPNSSRSFSLSLPNFDFLKFQYMCIMSGCDYLPSLPNIGLSKARRFFSLPLRCKNLRLLLPRMASYLKMPTLKIPSSYVEQFIGAHRLFLFQTIYDPVSRTFKPLHGHVRDLESLFAMPSSQTHPQLMMELIDSVLHNPISGTDINVEIDVLCPLKHHPNADTLLLHNLVMGNVNVGHSNLPLVDSYSCYYVKSNSRQAVASIWERDEFLEARRHTYRWYDKSKASKGDAVTFKVFDIDSWQLKRSTITESKSTIIADLGIEPDVRLSPSELQKETYTGPASKKSRYFEPSYVGELVNGVVDGGKGLLLFNNNNAEISNAIEAISNAELPCVDSQSEKSLCLDQSKSPLREINGKPINNDIPIMNFGDARSNAPITTFQEKIREKTAAIKHQPQTTPTRSPKNGVISKKLSNSKLPQSESGSPKFKCTRAKLITMETKRTLQSPSKMARKLTTNTKIVNLLSQYKYTRQK